MTRRISLGGVLAALILLLIMIRYFLPTADMAILAVTSLCLAIAVIELDLKTALVVYLASGLLSLAYPGIAASFPYLLFFGPYPLIRAIFDKRFNRGPATLFKLLAGNILVLSAIALFAWGDIKNLIGQYGIGIWFVLPIALQAVLLIFDYALSLLIQFYMTRLRRS